MKTVLSPCPPLSGLILAGGAGRRVHGADKAWLLWQQQPVITHVLAQLLPQVNELWISANRELDRYNDLPGCSPERIIRDEWPDYPGPLAGIASCLGKMPAGWALISPVDTPKLPQDLGLQLWRGLQQAQQDHANVGSKNEPKMAVACQRTAAGDEIIHWLHMLVHTSVNTNLRQRLAAGQRRVRDWCQSEHAVKVFITSEADCFVNLNNDSDYKAPH